MKVFKKIAILCSAFMMVASFALATACGGDGGNSSTDSSSSSGGYTGPTGDEGYVIPEDADPIIVSAPTSGNGGAFNRFECTPGYYDIDVPTRSEAFYSFSIPATVPLTDENGNPVLDSNDQQIYVGDYGLYALYTIGDADGVTITRYDASSQYIPSDENGYIGEEADVLPNGRRYSKANCNSDYWNNEWRATFGIKGTTSKVVRVRFVRIGDAIQGPETITYEQTVKELAGKASKPEYSTPVVVSYSSSFFYDENATVNVTPLGGGTPVQMKGFYRTGTAQNPGDIIYAAVNTTPTRLMDVTFSTAQDSGNALSLFYGEDEQTGNYIVYDYINFITNDNGGETAEDLTKLCYANVADENGMYPVNQELYEFLSLYVKNNPPYFEDADAKPADSKLWLAACYTYKQAKEGSKIFPYQLKLGENNVVIDEEYTHVYHCVKWVDSPNALQAVSNGYYTISTTDENASLTYNKKTFYGPFNITLEANKTDGAVMTLSCKDGKPGTFDVTVAYASGTSEQPYTLHYMQNGAYAYKLQQIFMLDGSMQYTAVYEFEASENNKVSVTAPDGVEVLLSGVDSSNIVFNYDPDSTTEKIQIYLTTTDLSLLEGEITVSVTPVETRNE